MRTPLLSALALLLAACADDRLASTEVDNHMTTVAGVVVDGAPIAGARVMLQSLDGTLLAVATTDTAGRFLFSPISTDSVFMVDAGALAAMAVPGMGSDTLRISVNPVSSEVVRRLGRTGSIRAGRLVRDSIGEVVARYGLGAGVPWDSLVVPAASAPATLVLNRLRLRAASEGIASVLWLERSESTGISLFADPEERRAIALEAARSGLGKSEVEDWLGELDQEHGDDSLSTRWFHFYDDSLHGEEGQHGDSSGVSRDTVEAMHEGLLTTFGDSLARLVSDSGDSPEQAIDAIVKEHQDAILLYVDPGHDGAIDSAQLVALQVLGRDLVSGSVFVLRHLRPSAWGTEAELGLQDALLSGRVMAGVDLAELLNATDPSGWLAQHRVAWPLPGGLADLRALAESRGIEIDSSAWR